MRKLLLHLAAAALLSGCHESASSQSGSLLYEQDVFKAYWYAGKAEIASYRLNQSRYGENHLGSAVLIFVTEDLSKTKQVKLDNPEKAGNDKVNVLKLNFTKKFVTGIYPYSMMLSVFTPVNHRKLPHSLKATMSSQEWCGHTFTQLNLKKNLFEVVSYSYFEQDGDSQFTVPDALLEDELWNVIRLDPDQLPTGEVKILPGMFHSRLNHTELTPRKAVIDKSVTDSLINYSLHYPSEGRTLRIQVEKEFPHKILGWAEELTGSDGKEMQTTAVLDKVLWIDYWTKNKNKYLSLRDSLGLTDN